LQPGTTAQIAIDSIGAASPNEIAVSAISATGVEGDPAIVAWPPAANSSTAAGRRRK
jgi:hypothetical protein